MNTYIDFVKKLVAMSSSIEAVYREICDDWAPDSPPVTTLFAAFGVQIAKDLRVVDVRINQEIFSLIETAMESDDSQLVSAVATGLIEALIAKTIQMEGGGLDVALFLGKRSKQHAKAWLSE